MRGFVTTRDLLLHLGTIVRTFGLRVYLRCIVRTVATRGRATFLECI
jgi:hypothetical protein